MVWDWGDKTAGTSCQHKLGIVPPAPVTQAKPLVGPVYLLHPCSKMELDTKLFVPLLWFYKKPFFGDVAVERF